MSESTSQATARQPKRRSTGQSTPERSKERSKRKRSTPQQRAAKIAIPALRKVANSPRLSSLVFGLHPWGNPFVAERYVWPYPIMKRIADDGPVVYSRLYQRWFVTGYESTRQVLSSSHMSSGAQVDLLMGVRPYSELSDWTQKMFGLLVVFADGEDHARLRRLVNKTFTPKQMASLEPRAEEICRKLLADVADQVEPDLYAAFTSRLPIDMISYLLGIPDDQWEWTSRVSEEIVKTLDPFNEFDPVVVDKVILELRDYILDLVEERRATPADDLITALVQAEDQGDRLSSDELVAMVSMIMVAGHETTTGLLGNAIVALAENPEQRELLRSNPDLWPNAVEELLRYDPPVQSLGRTATADITIDGVEMKKGSEIAIMVALANRDPARFDHPERLRLDRDDPRPLSLGHGMHHCLGAALARLELRVGLNAVLDGFGDYTIDPARVSWRQSVNVRSPLELPVKRAS